MKLIVIKITIDEKDGFGVADFDRAAFAEKNKGISLAEIPVYKGIEGDKVVLIFEYTLKTMDDGLSVW